MAPPRRPAPGLAVAVTGPTGEIGRPFVAALEKAREVARRELRWRPRHDALETLRTTVAAVAGP